MDALDRKGRFDSLLALKSVGNQSADANGSAFDIGSSVKSSFCMVNVNSITGSDDPALILYLEGSNDGRNWTVAAGMRISAAGLFRMALGDRGFRYWRYRSECDGTDTVINWSAFLTAD